MFAVTLTYSGGLVGELKDVSRKPILKPLDVLPFPSPGVLHGTLASHSWLFRIRRSGLGNQVVNGVEQDPALS